MKNELEKKYPFSCEQLQCILESIPANVFFKDLECRYTLTSHLCDMLNTNGTGSVCGFTDYDIMPDKEIGKKLLEEDKEILRTGKGVTYILPLTFGEDTYYYRVTKNPSYDKHGNLMGIIGIVLDMTEQIKMQKELEEYCNTDLLTGAYNRKYLENRLSSGEGFVYPLAVIAADCDYLKHVNDNFGHKLGDELLRKTVYNMRFCLPENAIIVRMGGDEFLIFLPECNEEKCVELVNRLRQTEAEISVGNINLSTSYGLAVISKPDERISDAITLADERMYEDKRNRRAGRS